MALKNEVFAICQQLKQSGWAGLLLEATGGHGATGLNIDQPDANALEAELLKTIAVDRNFPGFEDFSLEGRQGITPRMPGRSVLYHALASPKVIWKDRQRMQKLSVFPTLEQIEIVENYVYGIQPPSISFLKNLFPGREMAMVVLANQYRTAVDVPHAKHADLVFARTGVSRVGTAAEEYNTETRSFSHLVSENPHATRILPAKYNLYLAVKLPGSRALLGKRFNTGLQNFDNTPKDEDLFFWYPVHKIFPGHECFLDVDKPVDFVFSCKHVNEKIKRVHKFIINKFELDTGVDLAQLSQPPFTITDIADVHSIGSAAFVMPRQHPSLVQKAAHSDQTPVTLNKSVVLPHEVPGVGHLMLFNSSLEIRAAAVDQDSFPREAPEYMHIRTQVTGTTENNLNEKKNLIQFLGTQSYKALHYTDGAGDGFVTVQEVTGVPGIQKIVPAYSMVAAPDFFPLVDQADVLNQTVNSLNIWSIPPFTIADTRLLPNVSSHPELKPSAVERWDTVTALIPATLDAGLQQTNFTDKTEARISYLTDSAAGIFAPGWDTSFDLLPVGQENIPHLAAYGLGSPFPEDAKLCAALSSFWPAVAPDVTRSFWPQGRPTTIPMQDREIGANGQGVGWDGEKGPELIQRANKTFVRYKLFDYVDYTLNALHNQFNFHLLSNINSIEYLTRLRKMKMVKDFRNGQFNQWLFISYTQVDTTDSHVAEIMQNQGITLKPVIHKFIFGNPKATHAVPNQFELIDVEISKQVVVCIDAAEKISVLE